jgi:NAD(P)H-dependent FMN reductase
MLNLKTIIASMRPGRAGEPIGTWFTGIAQKHPAFEVEVLDLKEINLPFLDEPSHPRLQKYEHQHTKDWSTKVASGDAYVLVTPEYNHGYPASLKNALDFLYVEWGNKPVGFVSYGGIAGGTRALQQLKQIVTALQMVPIVEAVNIPFFAQYLDDEGIFQGTEAQEKSATSMLDVLAKWAEDLQQFRVSK